MPAATAIMYNRVGNTVVGVHTAVSVCFG